MMPPSDVEKHLECPHLLRRRIRTRLLDEARNSWSGNGKQVDTTDAAVLFLLGMHRADPALSTEPCLIFNQRSRHVRQPGDLCFPGGGLSPRLDRFLAGLLRLPGLPLFRWSPNDRHPPRPSDRFPEMPRLFATSLRESYEEMRLNPFRIRFLGPMMPEHFELHGRTIYPMVAWNHGQKTFSPNWEVDRIVYIPLRIFLDPRAYSVLPISRLSGYRKETPGGARDEFPCLVYENGEKREILWGLTFRIAMRFLDIVFGFEPPETAFQPITSNS